MSSVTKLLEIAAQRYEIGSTFLFSQMPPSHWHAIIDDPTNANAILADLDPNNAQFVVLNGESIRKNKA